MCVFVCVRACVCVFVCVSACVCVLGERMREKKKIKITKRMRNYTIWGEYETRKRPFLLFAAPSACVCVFFLAGMAVVLPSISGELPSLSNDVVALTDIK